MIEEVKEAREESLASYYIRKVKTKLASGEYKTEPVFCFCGADDPIPITNRDRYGFDYKMVLCKRCALMYANPRMTAESYGRFYAMEYRNIYDTEAETTEAVFKNGLKQGATLLEFLDHFEIHPKVIFDIGCNSGAMLIPFQEAGATTYGVDYDAGRTDYGRMKGLNILTGGMEELEKLNIKADLIILNHVFEHFPDLRASLSKIKALLSSDGIVFICVPGLYAMQREMIFQNAHTYQFTAQTLTYVMESCGFKEVYSDEYITSLWKPSAEKRNPENTPKSEIDLILNYLFEEKRKMPLFRTVNKFPMAKRRENIDKALSYGFPDISSILNTRNGTAIIIGGGPSVDGEIDTIHRWVLEGAAVITIERMYQWCCDNEIVPDYVVALDASDDIMESFESLHPAATHIVSVQCPSELFDILQGTRTHIFSTSQEGIGIADYWNKHNYDRATVINSGGSVTLCSLSIGMALGFRDFKMFGFDCHITHGDYAKNITGVGAISHVYEVEIEGRVFKTTSAYLSFAQQFFLLVQGGKDLGKLHSVRIYGDSMVPFMSKENISGES